VFNTIVQGEGVVFFLDGPRGSGKTFVYKVLLALVRRDGHVAIAVASSGIAALPLEDGRTAHSVFLALAIKYANQGYMDGQAILTTKNTVVNSLNTQIVEAVPGQEHIFLSTDLVETGDDQAMVIGTKFLNTITLAGMPPHRMAFKVGVPIMLLRNLDATSRLCNGTRLIISQALATSDIPTSLENLHAIHSGKEKKRKEKKKMSKGSSTTANKQITGDPLNFFCTAEAL
jgi:hypothetical protein